jgi:TPR repeat protein
MATLDPQNMPPRNMRAMLVGLFVAVVIGAAIGALGQQWHWSEWTKQTAQGELQLAQQALQDGDDEAAAALFTRLADQNNGKAQYWLGHMTEYGLGVARDPTKAIELYKKAAAQGVMPAEFRLGEIYLNGNLVLPDFGQAKSYLEAAAYRGDNIAALLLGRMYRDGRGMPADPIQAYAWFEVATLEGNAAARHERDAALGKLSASDQETAIARAAGINNRVGHKNAPQTGRAVQPQAASAPPAADGQKHP